MKALCVAAMLAAAAPTPAAAQAGACRLALAFALDVSASVDETEYRLQLDGLAAGLRDPAVRAAITGPGGGVALAAYEWSGTRQQAMIAPWTLVTTDAALDAFAARVTAHRRGYTEFPTAVGYALGYGAVLLRDAPPCQRRVIDISGDGLSNDGFGPDAAYRAFDFDGVTINGLVIGGEDLELISFYQFAVAHGPGAFVEVARDYTDYPRAMRRKLLREVAGDFVAEALPRSLD
jgi:Ca-activated chloride channel family protein